MTVSKSDIKNVAVLFGGRSSEHEISLRSAIFILQNIPENYSIIPVGINREGDFYSLEGKFNKNDFQQFTTENLAEIVRGQAPALLSDAKCLPSIFLPNTKESLNKSSFLSAFKENGLRLLNLEVDCIFPVLHGTNGEDGRLQGLFELAEIAYAGCDIRASVVGIDKDIQKRLARDAGVDVAKYMVICIEDFNINYSKVIENIEKNMAYPCFVKPNSLGSAVGTGKAKNREDLIQLLKEALSFDQKALVEELVVGTEIETAFLGSEVLPRITMPGEIATKDFILMKKKYSSQSEAQLFIPARLTESELTIFKEKALKIAKATGIQGLCRIDFWRKSSDGLFLFNEINTLPGLTSISMFPKLWEFEGVLGMTWIEENIDAAIRRKNMWSEQQFGIKAKL